MLDIEECVRAALFGDTRLNDRALKIVAGIIQGQASATSGTQGAGNKAPWPHTMGAFRFFDNDDVTITEMYGICREGILQIVGTEERVYVVHDLSVLDYSKHKSKKDVIAVGNERGRGYDLYTALVLNHEGLPIGPVVQELRNDKGIISSESLAPIPFIDHYSQVERGVEAARKYLPRQQRVHVMDREFDDVALERFYEVRDEQFIIRASKMARKIVHNGVRCTLGQAVASLELNDAGEVVRQGQRYKLWQAETQVVFDGLSWRGAARGIKPKKGKAIEVRVVVAELRDEQLKEPLRWVLLTKLTDPIEHVIEAYVWRWRVERFFYLAKIGLRLEAWLQQTGERIARRLALSSLAAMVVYQMQTGQDTELRQAVQVIATMGGWLGRKGDRIGPIVLMRGMMALIASLNLTARYAVRELVQMAERLGFGFAVPQELRTTG